MSNATTDRFWEKLVGQFRQMCLLRRQKKLLESDMILNSDLPRSIADWSKSFNADPALKKTRLDTMFQSEQRRMDDAWLVQDLIAARMNEDLIPAICFQVTQEVRSALAEELARAVPQGTKHDRNPLNARAGRTARVPFDDLPGVIDLVLAEEQNRAHAGHLETLSPS